MERECGVAPLLLLPGMDATLHTRIVASITPAMTAGYEQDLVLGIGGLSRGMILNWKCDIILHIGEKGALAG